MTGYYCYDRCKWNRMLDDRILFVGPCIQTKKETQVIVKEEDLEKWQAGGFVQNCFPYLKAWEREFLLNGYSEEVWKQVFGEGVTNVA